MALSGASVRQRSSGAIGEGAAPDGSTAAKGTWPTCERQRWRAALGEAATLAYRGPRGAWYDGRQQPRDDGESSSGGSGSHMSDQERQPERDLQAGAASGAWRRYLQPLIGGALVSLVVLVVSAAMHTFVAWTLDIHHEISLGLVHTSVASAVASVSALVAGMCAVLVEDRVLDERASALMWLAGCVLSGIFYLVLGILLLDILVSLLSYILYILLRLFGVFGG